MGVLVEYMVRNTAISMLWLLSFGFYVFVWVSLDWNIPEFPFFILGIMVFGFLGEEALRER